MYFLLSNIVIFFLINPHLRTVPLQIHHTERVNKTKIYAQLS